MSRSNARRRAALSSGYDGSRRSRDLLERERPSGVEQRRRQVEQPLQPIGHDGSVRGRRPVRGRGWRRGSERTHRARAITPRPRPPGTAPGRSSAGRPIDSISSPCASKRRSTSGGVDLDDVVAAFDARPRRGRRGGAPSVAPDAPGPGRGRAPGTPAGARSRCGARGRGGARAGRRTTRGAPRSGPRRARPSRRGSDPTSIPLNPSRVLVPTMPGPIATTATSARGDMTGDGQRREDRHRLEVTAERVPVRDGGVDQADASRSCATRSESASGRPAPSVITYTTRASGRGVLHRDGDRGELAVQRGGDDGHARRSTRPRRGCVRCSSLLPTSAWRLV